MSDPNTSLRVFISYARNDCSAFAEELLAGLEVAGFNPFLDRHDIAAGEDWEARLGGLIQSADTVVFVISPAAVTSERCAWEVVKAEALSKRIIPVVAMNVPEAETPHGLKRLNYIFFSDGHSFARGLGDLSKALRTDLDWIREHTRLGELAARWRAREKADVLLLRGSELDAAKAWLAGWKAPAPEPTDLHRSFIGESEAGEESRLGVERRRLAEISAAQTEREKTLRRLRRTNLIGGAVVMALLVATLGGGGQLWIKSAELDDARRQLREWDVLQARYEVELERDRRRLDQMAARLAQLEGSSAGELGAIRRELNRPRRPRGDFVPD